MKIRFKFRSQESNKLFFENPAPFCNSEYCGPIGSILKYKSGIIIYKYQDEFSHHAP